MVERLTRQEHLELFSRRWYGCHRCGRGGPQLRGTDRSRSPHRFRLDPVTVLLPFCAECEPGTEADRDEAMTATVASAADGRIPGLDPVPLDPLVCSVPECGQRWHDLGTALPFVPLYDTDLMLYRHPCPWCVAESPATVGAAHAATAAALGDPRRRVGPAFEAWLADGHPRPGE